MVLAHILGLLLLVSPPQGRSAAQEGESPLDGRLGGTIASLVLRLGEPAEIDPSLGLVFFPDGVGYLSVQVDHDRATYEPSDPALLMTLSADRDRDRPADQPDPGDWLPVAAERLARSFTPADAALGEIADISPGITAQRCDSDALRDALGAVPLGECRVTYLASSDDTVSFITLGFAMGPLAEDGAATPPPPCDGVAGWAEVAAGRLTEAQALLDDLGALPDDAAAAASELRRLSAAFRDLAVAQREAEAPGEVAKANYYLIGALNDFANALADAADGLEASDQVVIDAAGDDLASADARAVAAAREITSAAEACGLQP